DDLLRRRGNRGRRRAGRECHGRPARRRRSRRGAARQSRLSPPQGLLGILQPGRGADPTRPGGGGVGVGRRSAPDGGDADLCPRRAVVPHRLRGRRIRSRRARPIPPQARSSAAATRRGRWRPRLSAGPRPVGRCRERSTGRSDRNHRRDGRDAAGAADRRRGRAALSRAPRTWPGRADPVAQKHGPGRPLPGGGGIGTLGRDARRPPRVRRSRAVGGRADQRRVCRRRHRGRRPGRILGRFFRDRVGGDPRGGKQTGEGRTRRRYPGRRPDGLPRPSDRRVRLPARRGRRQFPRPVHRRRHLRSPARRPTGRARHQRRPQSGGPVRPRPRPLPRRPPPRLHQQARRLLDRPRIRPHPGAYGLRRRPPRPPSRPRPHPGRCDGQLPARPPGPVAAVLGPTPASL
ncbi:MAG: hypothetical protein AVDCRST_MAG73-4270, partial [uncultured Thermomicrobiales bacterium]